MELERTKNAYNNIIWGFINKFIMILVPFINRTVFIYILGLELLGLDSLFTSVLQMLNLAELGISSAIVYSMYKPIANDDKKMISALLRLYKKAYRYIGIFILVVGILIMPFIPYMIKGDVPNEINVYIIYLLNLLNTVIGYFCFSYKTALPNAFQRTDLLSNTLSISKIIQGVLQICVLVIVQNYYLYLSVLPIATFINNFIISKVVDRKYPEYVCKGEVPEDIKKDIKIKIKGLLINKICAGTRHGLDSICLSFFIGLTVTAMYNNYYYIISSITGIFGIITSSIVAGIGNSIELYDAEKNYDEMRILNHIYMLVAGWSSVVILCLYQPFMECWLGEESLFPMHTVCLLVIYFYILKMGDIRHVYVQGAGLWWENRYRAIIESVCNIVLNIILGYYCGVDGIIVATIISLLIINFGYGSRIIFEYYFNICRIKEYFIDHARYFMVSVSIAYIIYNICYLITGSIMIQLLLRIPVCVFLPVILYSIVYKKNSLHVKAMKWLLPKIKMGSTKGSVKLFL